MPTILLVEDNEESRDSLSRRLQRRGYYVVSARDGKQAVALAQSEKPDVILMDLNMPELDGWEATRQIKAHDQTRMIPIIAMTAHALSGDEETALAAGCDVYHTKPLDFPRLLTQIEKLLRNSKAPR